MSPLQIELHPTGVQPSELPFLMIEDVCRVLEAHGLQVSAPELNGGGKIELRLALGRLMDAIPAHLGGSGYGGLAAYRKP